MYKNKYIKYKNKYISLRNSYINSNVEKHPHMYGGNDIIVNLEDPREKKFDSMMGNLINYTPQFTGEIELIDLENDDIENVIL